MGWAARPPAMARRVQVADTYDAMVSVDHPIASRSASTRLWRNYAYTRQH